MKRCIQVFFVVWLSFLHGNEAADVKPTESSADAVTKTAREQVEKDTVSVAQTTTQTTTGSIKCPGFSWCQINDKTVRDAAKKAMELQISKADDIMMAVSQRLPFLRALCSQQNTSCATAMMRCPREVRGVFAKYCDGTEVRSTYAQMKENNLVTCLATATGKKFVQSLASVFAKAKARTKDPPFKAKGNTAAAEKRRKWARCAQQKAFRNLLCFLFRKYKDAGCSSDSQVALLQSRQLPMLKEENEMCHLPPIQRPSIMCKKANRLDKVRVTVGTYGCGHVRCFNQTDLLTCQSQPSDGERVLVETDTLFISAKVQQLPESAAIRYEAMKLVFRDSDLKEVLSVDLNNDAKPLLEGREQKVSVAKVKGAIRVTPQKDQVKFSDPQSGVQGRIRKYLIKGKLPAYSIILRMPNSFGEQARGLIFEGCLDNVDISRSNRKRRSVASDDAGKYDAEQTQDPNAASMASNAQADVTAVEKEDKEFTKGMESGGTSQTISGILLGVALLMCLIG